MSVLQANCTLPSSTAELLSHALPIAWERIGAQHGEGLGAHGMTESSVCQQQVWPKREPRGKSCLVVNKEQESSCTMAETHSREGS